MDLANTYTQAVRSTAHESVSNAQHDYDTATAGQSANDEKVRQLHTVSHEYVIECDWEMLCALPLRQQFSYFW